MVLLVVLVAVVVLFIVIRSLYSKKRKFPNGVGIAASGFMGSMYFERLQVDPVGWMREKAREFGALHAYSSVLGDAVMLTGPDALECFFSAKEDVLTIEALAATLVSVVGPLPDFGGVPFAEYSHEAGQQVLSSLRELRVRHHAMIQRSVEKVTQKWAATETTFDVLSFVSELLSTVNVQAFLGCEDESLVAAIPVAIDTLELKGLSFLGIFAPWLPFGPPEECRKVRSQIYADFAKVIPSIRAKGSIDCYAGYLASLNYPDHEIARRTLTVFIGAHINSIITLAWGLALVAKHNVVVDESNIASVLKELQRLTSLVILARQVKSSFEYNGVTIPAGCNVTVVPIFHAYDEKRFPNPTEFRPERWDDRSLSLPFFGGGPHVCPGQTYALAIIRTALLHICATHRIVLASNGPLPAMDFSRNRRPQVPIMMRLEPK